MNTFPFFCGRDCGGDACALLATIDNGQVTRSQHNPAGGEFLQGCRRGFDQPLFHHSPERVLSPLVRVGERGSGQFREASWEEALEITATQLGEVREKYGAEAVLNLSSAGDTGALHCTYLLLSRFLNLFGGATSLKGSYSTGAASYILPYVFGDDVGRSGFDAATMQNAQMIILWGANLLDTRMGSQLPHRLSQARERGA
ncbi:MAG: molybdopterin-dependent oxidoreductase [Anaerolineaceae bacterium]|nr:molybdopterin-dependent oxidoreductase [Anaerolineaceae bacterium]